MSNISKFEDLARDFHETQQALSLDEKDRYKNHVYQKAWEAMSSALGKLPENTTVITEYGIFYKDFGLKRINLPISSNEADLILERAKPVD